MDLRRALSFNLEEQDIILVSSEVFDCQIPLHKLSSINVG